MHEQRRWFWVQLQAVVVEYIEEIMGKLGVSEGDVWQLWHFTEKKVNWHHFKVLVRIHWHLSHVLALLMGG